MDFSGIIHKIRDGLGVVGGDIGGFFSGFQPHNNPAPQAQQFQQPQMPQAQQQPRMSQQQFSVGQPFKTTPQFGQTTAMQPQQTFQLQQQKPVDLNKNQLVQSTANNPITSNAAVKPPANPFANDTPAQSNAYPNIDPQIRQTIQNSVHLNPQQKVNMLQRLNNDKPVQFNPVQATVQSLGEGAQQIGHGIANMTGATSVTEAARLGVGKATDNQGLVDSATQNLATDLPQFLPVALAEGVKPFAQDVASAAVSPYAQYEANQAQQYAQKELNDRTSDPAYNAAVDAYAANQKQQLLEDNLNRAGFTSQTNPTDLARKVGGAGLQAGASIAMAGLAPELAGASPTEALLGNMANFGAQNAASNVGQTLQQDSPTPGDVAGSAAVGFAQGAAMPLVFAGVRPGASLLSDATRAGVNNVKDFMTAPAAQAAERASGLSRDNIINDNEAGTLRDFADYKTGSYRPDVPTINRLLMQTRNAAQTAGVDVNTGSPAQVTDRIYNYLRQRQQFITAHDAVMQGGYIGGLPDQGAAAANEGFKYKREIGGGTQRYNELNQGNSFQDVNGIRHPLQSNATFYIGNYDGTGETRAIKVKDITSQSHFNNLIRNYGGRGNLLNVEVDESPALNDVKLSPTIEAAPHHDKAPAGSEIEPFVQEYAAEHTANDIAQEHADMLHSLDQGARGGVITENGTRTTEHTPFYSQYFAEHGRAPSKAAYLEQATKELEAGKGDMLDPGMADAYQLAKQREIEENALAEQGSRPEIEQQSYYFGPNKNEGAFSKEDLAALMGEEPKQVSTSPVITPPHETTEADVSRVLDQNPMLPGNAVTEKLPERSANLDREAQYILQNGGTLDEAANVYIEGANKSYADAVREANRVAQESHIDLGGQNPAANPLFNRVNLPKAENWQQAVLNADAVVKNIADLRNFVMQTAKGLSQHDLELLDKTRNIPVEQLAREAEKPEQFIRVAAAAKNLNDYTQEVGRMTGQNVAYRPSYGARMFYDLTDPESAKAYEAYKASLKTKPGYGQRRNISSYEEAAALGIKRAHGNYLEDLMHDAVSRGNDLAQLTLAKNLEEAYPGQVKVGEIGFKPSEGTYEQLRIAHGNRISVPKALADQINSRASYQYQHGGFGRVLRAYDSYNGLTKFFKLSLGGFHNVVELSAFTARSIVHGDFGGIIKNIETIASKKVFDKEFEGFRQRGTLEKARFGGLTLNDSSIAADAGGKVRLVERGKYNPIRVMHDALFGRQIPYAKLRIFEDETKGLSLDKAEDVAKIRAASRALNNSFGGINRLVDGLTPVQSKLLSRAVLALDYNEGQARALVSAISKKGVEGRIARQVVLGRMVMLAAPGIVAYSLQHGAQNDPGDILKRIADQILDPHIPLPFKSASGIDKVGELPTNVAGKAWRAVQPFFDPNETNKFNGVEHELSGNLASGPSTLSQLTTNRDYYGQPIVVTDPNTGKVKLGQSAANVAGQFEPISGGQVTKVVTGQESPAEGAVNVVGVRTKDNPDDPRIQIMNNHTKVFNGLNAQDQSAMLQVHPSWGNLPKDQQDQIYANPHYEEQKWDTLLSNQNVFDATKKQDAFAAQHGQPANPLFGLNDNDAKTVMTYEWLKHADPGSGANNTAAVIYNQNQALIQKFEKDYANYGQQMNQLYQQTGGLKGDNSPALQIGGAPQYHPDQQTVDAVNQYFTLNDPKARVQFMNGHPEINNYFESLYQAENQVRASLNEPLLKDYPKADQATQNFINQYTATKDKATRAALRNGNPDLYKKMQAYMEQTDEYNVAKYAGQDQFVGQGLNQQALKAIFGLGNYDIMQNPDGTLALTGSAQVQPGAKPMGGSGGGSGMSRRAATNYLRHRPKARAFRTPPKPYIRTIKKPEHLRLGHVGYRVVPEGKFTSANTVHGIKNISATKGTGIKAFKVV